MVKRGEKGVPRSPETRAKIGVGARNTRLNETVLCPYACGDGMYNSGNLVTHVKKYHEFSCKIVGCRSTIHKGLGYCIPHHRLHSYCKKYGITLEKYLSLFEQQGGRCRICRKEGYMAGTLDIPRVDILVTDHCHTSGLFRGIICNSCNLGLAHFKDNTSALETAILYLKEQNDPVHADD